MILSKHNVWIVGSLVSDDWRLIRALKRRHVVTVAESFDAGRLKREPVLGSATLLVLDVTGRPTGTGAVFDAIASLTLHYPGLRLILVDGGLDQRKIAQAFRTGVHDYFRAPYDADLLAERVAALCRRKPPR